MGNFSGIGAAKPDDFYLDVVVVWEVNNAEMGGVKIYDVSGDLMTLTSKGKYCSFKLKAGRQITVATGDFDGDSVVLGEPIHWVIEQHYQPSVILGKPPKHIDYIADASGDWTVVNLSRKQSFYSEFKDSESKTATTTSKSTSDWNFGVEVATSAETDFGVPLAGKVGVNVSASAKHTYSQHEAEMNKNYTETIMGLDLKATNDDYVVCRIMDVNVWKYPALQKNGKQVEVEAEDGTKGPLYIQITLPSGETVGNLEGRIVEWYQPVHESGNVFSYPWSEAQIGDYSEANLLSDLNTFAAGGNEATFFVVWKDDEGAVSV